MKTALMMLVCGAAVASAVDNPNRNFSTTFTGCREFVAFGPISYSAAQAALPPGFTAALTGSDGGLVLRASVCDGVSVAGSAPKPGVVAHYGVNIVSPDGTGHISNYTLSYATNSEALADRLSKAGLPAIYNPALAVEDPVVRPGNVFVSVFGEGLPPWFLTGLVENPAGAPFPFIANWWYQSKTGRLKMSTDIAAIAFGSAQLVLHTASNSALGQLINGNTKTNFPFYNVRGRFASAVMNSTTAR